MPPSTDAPLPVAIVADDEWCVREFLVLCLQMQGFAALGASTGEAAVEMLLANEGRAALALIDLHMPGAGGLATVAALRRIKPWLRCCLMTGDLGGDEEALAAGADCVLHKPMTPAALAACVRHLQSEALQPWPA